MLFDLISAQNYVTYDYLENNFEVTKRTIREDIKCLNDILSKEYHVEIQHQSGRGFFLSYESDARLEQLTSRLNMRFSDLLEIEDSMEDNYYRIVAYFFTRQGYGRMDELSNLLNLNPRSISNLLKEARKKLNRYHLSILVRPHYGMMLSGRESHIRYCIMDIIYRYSSELKNGSNEETLNMFKLNSDHKKHLYSICVEYIDETKIELSQTAIHKFIILLMVSRYREMNGITVNITEKERQLYDQLSHLVSIDVLCDKLERLYQTKLDENLKIFLGIYVLAHLESYRNNELIKEMARPVLNDLLDYLTEYGISADGGCRNNWESGMSHIIKQVVLISAFDIFERSPNTAMKKAVKTTPLSSSISELCHRFLETYLSNDLGEAVFVNLTLAIYSCIRNFKNIRRMNTLAVLTPGDKCYGESLKRRVLDRYSNIIRNIEVLSITEVYSGKLALFDTLLYCGNLEPIETEVPINKLKVDYFFTEEDVQRFYENIVVPSRIYKRAFAKLYEDDYIEDYLFTSMEDLIQKFIAPRSDEMMMKQIENFVVDEYGVFNRTLNIVLFTKKEENTFSKLLFLRNTATIKSVKFIRIFIHSIKLDGDLIKQKSSEKVIRNLTAFKDSDNDIIFHNRYDFYDFYINNDFIPLLKR